MELGTFTFGPTIFELIFLLETHTSSHNIGKNDRFGIQRGWSGSAPWYPCSTGMPTPPCWCSTLHARTRSTACKIGRSSWRRTSRNRFCCSWWPTKWTSPTRDRFVDVVRKRSLLTMCRQVSHEDAIRYSLSIGATYYECSAANAQVRRTWWFLRFTVT